jgi:hypothetical protein
MSERNPSSSRDEPMVFDWRALPARPRGVVFLADVLAYIAEQFSAELANGRPARADRWAGLAFTFAERFGEDSQ